MFVVVAFFFGITAAAIFLKNWSMYPRLRYIRKGKNGPLKKKLVVKLRTEMKRHAPIGWVGLALVLVHGSIQLSRFINDLGQLKMISGMWALFLLLFTVGSGWYRSKKATGFRRKAHLWIASLFLLFMIFHIFN